MSIAAIWSEIDGWLGVNAPGTLKRLAAPASSDEIATLEQVLDAKLPDNLRESLSIHDGETENEAWLFSDWSLLSSCSINRCWQQELKKADKKHSIKLSVALITNQILFLSMNYNFFSPPGSPQLTPTRKTPMGPLDSFGLAFGPRWVFDSFF